MKEKEKEWVIMDEETGVLYTINTEQFKTKKDLQITLNWILCWKEFIYGEKTKRYEVLSEL